jgi:hypothetical protein
MKVVRFKTEHGQRIWRVTWGKDGKFLGRPVEGAWPKLSARLSDGQKKYWHICNVANVLACNSDKKGFLWLIEGRAEASLEIIKYALTDWKPTPRWVILAMSAGWKPPKGWELKDCIGDGPWSWRRST